MTSHRSIHRATVAFVLAAVGALQGCADHEPEQASAAAGAGQAGAAGAAGNAGTSGKAGASGKKTADGGFVSDAPGTTGSKNDGEDSASPGASGAGGASSGAGGSNGGSAGQSASPDDPKKTIEEADILQLRGSRLYALSRYSGLAIIDVSKADDLKLLGRYPLSGEPFEMYVRDNTVFAMFSSWGRYECDANYESCKWVTSSHIAALDATDPANLQPKGTFDLPGEISDSRIVGDVLYAVSYENGYCWECSDKPTTTISSLDLSNLQNIHRVDAVSYDESSSYGGWRRSISVNDKRIFVAGVEWNYNDNNQGHSTVQVVDISDPSGKMKLGASVEVHGQIESRWQMDEYQGALRVISQPGQWNAQDTPRVQTFQVESADKLTPLADLDFKLAEPERLRSVRFDGPRAFAITAVQKDPLFTFDLTDPAQPKQLGELEMPGWIYHMEPRGDRLLALGFDNGNENGSLHVSLFDISKLDQPTMLSRVNFGGSWGNFAEDQDRIHKAFTILEDKGMILVPYAGWEQAKGPGGEIWGCGSYKSGIQIVDYSKDALTRRGVAPQKGQARRAFMKEDTLFALSDDKLRTFDIADRDAPAMKDEMGLSHKVSRTAAVGDKLVRLAADWWTGEAWLDAVPLDQAESVEAPVQLDLSAYTGKGTDGCYNSNIYGARLLSNGDTLTMIWGDYQYWYDGPGGYGNTEAKTHVLTIDVANPAAPKVLGHSELPFAFDSYGYGYYGYYGYYGGWLMDNSDSLVQLGSTVALRRFVYDNNNYSTPPRTVLEVIDLSDAANPTHAASLDLPGGDFQTGLRVAGPWVISSHSEPVADQPNKVRFFLDRIDLSNPKAPVSLDPINVPGSPLRYDTKSGSLVSVDYKRTATPAQTWEECYGTDAYYYGGYGKWFDYESKECVTLRKSLKLSTIDDTGVTLLDSLDVDSDTSWMEGIVFANDRLFGMTYSNDPKAQTTTQSIVSIQGLNQGKFSSSEQLLETGKSWYYGSYGVIGTSDDSAVLMSWSNENTIFTLDPAAPAGKALTKRGELRSWASDVRIAQGRLIASLDDRGVQVVSLKLAPVAASPALIGGAALLFYGRSQIPSACKLSSHECQAPPGDPAFEDARKSVSTMNVGFVVGGVGAAVTIGGLLWYFTSGPFESRQAVTPWAAPRSAGLSYGLRF